MRRAHLEELNLLYTVKCGRCGCCIDDHEDPYQYGHDEKDDEFSIFACLEEGNFEVAAEDVDELVLVAARRSFWGLRVSHLIMDNDNAELAQRILTLLAKKSQQWEKERQVFEEAHQYDHIGGAVLLIVPGLSGSSYILDVGS